MKEIENCQACDCGIAELSPKDWIGVPNDDNPHAPSCPAHTKNIPSYGENKAKGGSACHCRPTNTLYWELSDADVTNCPMHNPDLMFELPNV